MSNRTAADDIDLFVVVVVVVVVFSFFLRKNKAWYFM